MSSRQQWKYDLTPLHVTFTKGIITPAHCRQYIYIYIWLSQIPKYHCQMKSTMMHALRYKNLKIIKLGKPFFHFFFENHKDPERLYNGPWSYKNHLQTVVKGFEARLHLFWWSIYDLISTEPHLMLTLMMYHIKIYLINFYLLINLYDTLLLLNIKWAPSFLYMSLFLITNSILIESLTLSHARINF